MDRGRPVWRRSRPVLLERGHPASRGSARWAHLRDGCGVRAPGGARLDAGPRRARGPTAGGLGAARGERRGPFGSRGDLPGRHRPAGPRRGLGGSRCVRPHTGGRDPARPRLRALQTPLGAPTRRARSPRGPAALSVTPARSTGGTGGAALSSSSLDGGSRRRGAKTSPVCTSTNAGRWTPCASLSQPRNRTRPESSR